MLGLFSCANPLVRSYFLGQLQRAATAPTADRKWTIHLLAVIYLGRM